VSSHQVLQVLLGPKDFVVTLRAVWEDFVRSAASIYFPRSRVLMILMLGGGGSGSRLTRDCYTLHDEWIGLSISCPVPSRGNGPARSDGGPWELGPFVDNTIQTVWAIGNEAFIQLSTVSATSRNVHINRTRSSSVCIKYVQEHLEFSRSSESYSSPTPSLRSPCPARIGANVSLTERAVRFCRNER